MLPTQPCWNKQLLETARPPGPDDPLGGGETKAFARARYRSLQGARATTCLRARPTDSLHVLPAAKFVGIGRRFTEIEEHVAMRCPCCDAVDVDTRHARICPRAGAQVNQHRLLLHAISHTLKRLRIPHQVESGEPFAADTNLRMELDRHQESRCSGRSEQSVRREVHPAGCHPRKPTSAGAPARRKR